MRWKEKVVVEYLGFIVESLFVESLKVIAPFRTNTEKKKINGEDENFAEKRKNKVLRAKFISKLKFNC